MSWTGNDSVARDRLRNSVLLYMRPLVVDVLTNWERYQWTLQGFGMLRAYVSRDLRLHVWNSKFAVPDVTTVHDHPWHFESCIVAGRIVNTRYTVHPCWHTDEQVKRQRLREPFIKSQIVCGVGGGNTAAEVKARGERVWLEPLEPETYRPGNFYQQLAHEVHHSSYDDGTVTLVSRKFLPDTEHAHVFFRADKEWVSAEPREASRDEVVAITASALLKLKEDS
jgi:hypothetical protein